MLLVKIPIPVPSEVKALLVVGLSVVAQQTPFAVTGAPPEAEIFPPEVAVVYVTADGTVVVIVGTDKRLVENDTSFPYPVPALFVAYART
jgi:hypothetical protein